MLKWMLILSLTAFAQEQMEEEALSDALTVEMVGDEEVVWLEDEELELEEEAETFDL